MRLADLDFELFERIVVARLKGEIDMSNAAELGSAISDRVRNDLLGLVLDMNEVDYVDSAGIHALFELRSRLKERGQEMRLVLSPEAAIAEALRIVGIPAAVRVSESTDAALESIAAGLPPASNRGRDH